MIIKIDYPNPKLNSRCLVAAGLIAMLLTTLAASTAVFAQLGIEGAGMGIINGIMYVSHGYRGGDGTTLFAYDIANNTWTQKRSATFFRSELIGVAGPDSKYYAIGGRPSLNVVEIYDPSTDSWSLGTPMPTARAGLGAAVLGNQIHVLGGRTGPVPHSGTPLSVHEAYDVTTGTWTTLAPMPTPMMDVYSTVALNGKIYVIGGYNGAAISNLVQIYDASTNSWSFGTPMPTPRSNLIAGVLGGRIIAIGGYNGTNNLNVVEIYDPITNSWIPGPSKPNAASEMAAGSTYTANAIFAVGSGIFGAAQTFHEALVISDSGLSWVFKAPMPVPVRIKYKIAGQPNPVTGQNEVTVASTDDATLLAAIRSDLTARGISEKLMVTGLSLFEIGPTSEPAAIPSIKRWIKVTNVTVRSNDPVGASTVEPLLIPDSANIVTAAGTDIASAKKQYYRLYSIPLDLGKISPSSALELDSVFTGLGNYKAPTVSRTSGYFISNFKRDQWTNNSTDVSLAPGQGGIIRAAGAEDGVSKFIQLTGSSTPPEGDRSDSAIGKMTKTEAEPAHTGVDMELKPGWNIVGVPMYRRFFWSLTGGIFVVNLDGVVIGAVGSSSANGMVSPVIYGGYNGLAYTKTIDASDINLSATNASRVMQPFEGYWVFAFLPCKLRFLASFDGPDSSPSTAPPLETITEKQRLMANGGWGISLLAKTINSIDAGNIIGYGLKEVEYMKPPSLFEDDVRLSILGEDGSELTKSMISRLEDEDFVGAQHAAPYAPYWDIKVDATGDVPVTISGEMLNLPKEYQVILISSDGVEVANLKEAPYTYIPKHSGIEIFKVVVTKKKLIPKRSELLQNYPNPFNPETWIPYQLSDNGKVSISIYDVQGRLVRSLNLGRKEAGVYIRKEEAAYWDGRNSLGERVSSGLYFYSIQAGQFIATRKMVVVK